VRVEAGSRLAVIGDSCFEETALRAFRVPAAVEEIHDRAFHTASLAALEIEDGGRLRAIGSGALSETRLPRFALPAGVTDLGSWVFLGCAELRALVLEPAQIPFIGCWLCEGTQIETIAVPASVEVIEAGAFENLQSLRAVEFPGESRLTRIASRAFAGTGLAGAVALPASLARFELEVFDRCARLTEVTLPVNSALESLCKGAFQNSGVVRLVLPGIKHLAEDVFVGCAQLRSVRFVLPGQSDEMRKREIRVPPKIFDGIDVHVIYPQGTLKRARQLMKSSILGDFI
jgi:hypothetical protein